MGGYIPKRVWDQVLPFICTLQEVCRGSRLAMYMELMWNQESPGCFGPHPAALVSQARTQFGFTQT